MDEGSSNNNLNFDLNEFEGIISISIILVSYNILGNVLEESILDDVTVIDSDMERHLKSQKESSETIEENIQFTPSSSEAFSDDEDHELEDDVSPALSYYSNENKSWLGNSSSDVSVFFDGESYITSADCSTPTDKISHVSSLCTAIGIIFKLDYYFYYCY